MVRQKLESDSPWDIKPRTQPTTLTVVGAMAATTAVESLKAEPQRVPPFLRMATELRLFVYKSVFFTDKVLLILEKPPEVSPDRNRGFFKIGSDSVIVTNENTNRLYSYLLANPPTKLAWNLSSLPAQYPSSPLGCREAYPMPINSSLLRVCKRVHAEALPVLYSQNKFAFEANMGTARLLRCLDRSALSKIRELHLAVTDHMLGTLEQLDGNFSVWDTITLSCPNLDNAVISFEPFRGVHEGCFMQTVYRFAHTVAVTPEVITMPKFVALCQLVPRANAPICRLEQNTTIELMYHKMERLRFPQLSKGGKLQVEGSIFSSSFDDMSRYRKNAWGFRRRDYVDSQGRNMAELVWTRDS